NAPRASSSQCLNRNLPAISYRQCRHGCRARRSDRNLPGISCCCPRGCTQEAARPSLGASRDEQRVPGGDRNNTRVTPSISRAVTSDLGPTREGQLVYIQQDGACIAGISGASFYESIIDGQGWSHYFQFANILPCNLT